MDSAESLVLHPPRQLILLSSLTQMSLCNRWNFQWHRGDATKCFCVLKSRTKHSCVSVHGGRKGTQHQQHKSACLVFFPFSAESVILWLSYGSEIFHAPLSAFARTHPNEIIGNEIRLDESPGLHSPCHDFGIQMSCWNRYTSRTLPKRQTVLRGCAESKASQHLLPDFPAAVVS